MEKIIWHIIRVVTFIIAVVSCYILYCLDDPMTPRQIITTGLIFSGFALLGIILTILADKKLQQCKIDNYSRIFPSDHSLSNRLYP